MYTSPLRALRTGLGISLLLAVALITAPAALAVDCRISGTVSDSGFALAGVTVEALDGLGAVVAETTTGPDGTYALEALAPGSYRVWFRHGSSDYCQPYFDGALDFAHAEPIVLDEAHSAFVANVDIPVRTLPGTGAAADGGPAAALKISVQGTSLACSGDTLAIGASEAIYARDGTWAGAVYVYRHTAAGWRFEGRLFAPHPSGYSRFGISVAIDGDVLLVADARYSGSDRSRVYAYQRTNGHWRFKQMLTPAGDVAARRGLGTSMAVSGNAAVLGAPSAKVGGQMKAGAAFVFKLQGSRWIRAGRIASPHVGGADAFGSAVALRGSTAIIGAPFDDDVAGVDSGGAYVFAPRDGVWKCRQRLKVGAKGAHAQFGSSIAMDAGRAVVAAPRLGRGAAFVYARGARGWRKQAGLLPLKATVGGFATSVAIGGRTVIVGAPLTGAVFERSKRPGAVYQYVRTNGAWRRADVLGLGEMEGQSGVGSGVGILGRQFVVLSEWDSRTMDTSLYSVRIYDPYVTEAATPLKISASDGVLMNDLGPGFGLPGVSQLVNEPLHGQLDLREDGSFTYTPDAGYVGLDSFRYCDWIPYSWSSEPATATISVR